MYIRLHDLSSFSSNLIEACWIENEGYQASQFNVVCSGCLSCLSCYAAALAQASSLSCRV